MTDFRRPALPIERTDRRVEIERGFLDVGEGLDVARAQVYARHDRACERRVPYVVLAGDVVGRVDKAVRHVADDVARVGGAEHRRDKVGSLVDAIGRESDAHIVAMVRDAESARDVEHAGDPDGAVDRKPGQRLGREPRLSLQHVVRKDHRRVEVPQEVVDRCPHRRRHRGAIALRDRHQDHSSTTWLNPKIERFSFLERVVELDFGGLGLRAWGRPIRCREQRNRPAPSRWPREPKQARKPGKQA